MEPVNDHPSTERKIRLEPLKVEDFPLIRPWIEPRVFRIFHEPVDNAQLKRLLTKYESGRPQSLGLRIVRTSDEQLIGVIHSTIDWKNNLAHVGQIVLGDLMHRNAGFKVEGLMREATRIQDGYVSWYSMSILEEEWKDQS
ncbi:MAG: hypothetical protein KJ970_15145 [Candidatus Eisenbacteria bacterium]|uniref:GNAT family N-acetyltransferase n=1 Tax=Eiseniibacteriota bacterium TaxID=2212470 RepID=A0A948W4I5_UNCEI|nr:hypothetical protein [Candidatus Eisenbacteria bacterium]MBU1948364.1 hypothetical protein [Candidatus Eisenbacteria bacterium]MBU2692257.1 hypothetical protein [Candidatus Eisenbacteria bacterium]